MAKIIRRVIIFLAIVLGFGYYQWNMYEQKTQMREDALLYFGEEDYTKSIQYFEEALGKRALFSDEMNKDMNCYLAESYYCLGEYNKAVEIYDRLLEKDDTNVMYYRLKGECQSAAGKDEEAVEVFKEGYEKTGKPDLLKEICDIYITQENYEKALEYALKGAGDNEEPPKELLYQTIIIYEKSQNYEAALQAAKEYCERYPEDKEAQKELVFLSTRVE